MPSLVFWGRTEILSLQLRRVGRLKWQCIVNAIFSSFDCILVWVWKAKLIRNRKYISSSERRVPSGPNTDDTLVCNEVGRFVDAEHVSALLRRQLSAIRCCQRNRSIVPGLLYTSNMGLLLTSLYRVWNIGNWTDWTRFKKVAHVLNEMSEKYWKNGRKV